MSTRAKTIDTLRDKLNREENLHLNQVQDLAGVRVDMDGTLDEQTAFAEEVATFFSGPGRVEIKDIRKTPHSGYRAVHLWLRLPAGRVEVQIRTRGQSAWANAYERLGDLVGRHIRYGESHKDPSVRDMVEGLHDLSETLAQAEEAQQESEAIARRLEVIFERRRDRARAGLEGGLPESFIEKAAKIEELEEEARQRVSEVKAFAGNLLDAHVAGLRRFERMLDGEDDMEAGDSSVGVCD